MIDHDLDWGSIFIEESKCKFADEEESDEAITYSNPGTEGGIFLDGAQPINKEATEPSSQPHEGSKIIPIEGWESWMCFEDTKNCVCFAVYSYGEDPRKWPKKGPENI